MKRVIALSLSFLLTGTAEWTNAAVANPASVAAHQNASLVKPWTLDQAIPPQLAWGTMFAGTRFPWLRKIRLLAVELIRRPRGIFDHPAIGMALAAMLTGAVVTLTLAPGGVSIIHLPTDLTSLLSKGGISIIYLPTDWAAVFSTLLARLGLLEVAAMVAAFLTLILVPHESAPHQRYSEIRFNESVPGRWSIIEYPTWGGAFFGSNTLKRHREALRSIFAGSIAIPAVTGILMFSIAWTVAHHTQSANGAVVDLFTYSFTALFFYLVLMRPSPVPLLRDYPLRRMFATSVGTVALAMVFSVPYASIHGWGHWLVSLLFYAPSGGIFALSAMEEMFFPVPGQRFSPLLSILKGMTADDAEALYYTFGFLVPIVYGILLLFFSYFFKRGSVVRRGMQLAAGAMSIFSFQHFAASLGFNSEWDGTRFFNTGNAFYVLGTLAVFIVTSWGSFVQRTLSEVRDWAMIKEQNHAQESFLTPAALRFKSSLRRVLVWVVGVEAMMIVFFIIKYPKSEFMTAGTWLLINCLCISMIGVLMYVTYLDTQQKSIQEIQETVVFHQVNPRDYERVVEGLTYITQQDPRMASWVARELAKLWTFTYESRLPPEVHTAAVAGLSFIAHRFPETVEYIVVEWMSILLRITRSKEDRPLLRELLVEELGKFRSSRHGEFINPLLQEIENAIAPTPDAAAKQPPVVRPTPDHSIDIPSGVRVTVSTAMQDIQQVRNTLWELREQLEMGLPSYASHLTIDPAEPSHLGGFLVGVNYSRRDHNEFAKTLYNAIERNQRAHPRAYSSLAVEPVGGLFLADMNTLNIEANRMAAFLVLEGAARGMDVIVHYFPAGVAYRFNGSILKTPENTVTQVRFYINAYVDRQGHGALTIHMKKAKPYESSLLSRFFEWIGKRLWKKSLVTSKTMEGCA